MARSSLPKSPTPLCRIPPFPFTVLITLWMLGLGTGLAPLLFPRLSYDVDMLGYQNQHCLLQANTNKSMTKSAVATAAFKPGAKATKAMRTDTSVLDFICRSTLLNTLFLCDLPFTSRIQHAPHLSHLSVAFFCPYLGPILVTQKLSTTNYSDATPRRFHPASCQVQN
ncbi:hypothetical protein L208DRAFT_1409559 [Tricholoma matsutake]|nr:hypothetical protein L208DRAFT_1409559 [Tricholoma matsutake 945]